MNRSPPATPYRRQHGRLQPQLSTLLNEVRTFSRQVERAAASQAGQGTPAYSACLSELFHNAITERSGRDQLVSMAAAVEHGVLQWQHLSRAARTVNDTADRALRALYWATATRWQRANARRPARLPEKPARADLATLTLCEHCVELQQDCRRYAPHDGMKHLCERTSACNDEPIRCWFHCEGCDVLWARRLPPHEPFAIWSVVRAGSL